MGPMILFTGCRTKDSDLYLKEKREMVRTGVLNHNFLALSRDPAAVTPRVTALLFMHFLLCCNVICTQQTYVQDLLLKEAQLVYRMITQENGHLYVCGDSRMADDVTNTLLLVLKKAGRMNQQESKAFFNLLRVCF